MAAVEHAISVRGHGHKGARWVRGFCTIRSGPDLAGGWQYWRARTRTIEPDDLVTMADIAHRLGKELRLPRHLSAGVAP